jgi:hypothetical protein
MSKIFISYRREDSQDVTGRIYDRLVEYFTPTGIFKDVDNIPLGLDFRKVLDDAIGKAGAVVAIIGPTWISCTDPDGHRRLDSPADFVRLEVETALQRNLPVIPVVVSRGRMPSPDELPDSLKPLVYRNGMAVRPDPDFNHDMESLAVALQQWIVRPTSTQRPTLHGALADLAREREVERIDREWATEQIRYNLPVGALTSWRIGVTFVSLVFAIIGLVVSCVLGANFGAGLALIGFPMILIGLGICIHENAKINRYEAAEAVYRQKRAITLAKGKEAEAKEGGEG